MSQGKIQRRPYGTLLLLAAVLGLAIAIITFIFMALVQVGQNLLWEQAAQAVGLSAPVFTVFVCALGGLLVGVLVKLFGDHLGIFAEPMLEFGRSGRFNYRYAPGIVLTELPSQIFGGSQGTWLAGRLKLDVRRTRSLGFSGLS